MVKRQPYRWAQMNTQYYVMEEQRNNSSPSNNKDLLQECNSLTANKLSRPGRNPSHFGKDTSWPSQPLLGITHSQTMAHPSSLFCVEFHTRFLSVRGMWLILCLSGISNIKRKNESINTGWEPASEIRTTASLLTQHTSCFHILTPWKSLHWKDVLGKGSMIKGDLPEEKVIFEVNFSSFPQTFDHLSLRLPTIHLHSVFQPSLPFVPLQSHHGPFHILLFALLHSHHTAALQSRINLIWACANKQSWV